MSATNRGPDQAASVRLRRLIENGLTRRGWTAQEAAREAKLPADAFRTVLNGAKNPTSIASRSCAEPWASR